MAQLIEWRRSRARVCERGHIARSRPRQRAQIQKAARVRVALAQLCAGGSSSDSDSDRGGKRGFRGLRAPDIMG